MTSRLRGARVLIVDDEKAIRDALRLVLEHEGLRVSEAGDGEEAIRLARTSGPDAILLDIQMPKMNGLETLERLRRLGSETPVLMVSGHGTIETAVNALKLGAQDFLEKPLEREIVLARLGGVLERAFLRSEVATRVQEEEQRFVLVGESSTMQGIKEMISKAGPTQATVLITGESGTGKELVARSIHRSSSRSAAPFVKVNCAAIPDDLIESELFGHEKGAFTGAATKQRGRFARADGGTIFLDEIGDMSLKTQAKVLRALQDGEIEPLGAGESIRVDVRVIAATNKDLREEIRDGNFREDLFYRLSVLPIHIPPLRERKDDIALLVRHLTELICAENNFRHRSFSDEALDELASRPWRGNVRELRNAIERALILASGDELGVDDLPEAEGAHGGPGSAGWGDAGTLREFKERAERGFLESKLAENGWNITRTAQAIDTPRSNLYKRIEHHGLNSKERS